MHDQKKNAAKSTGSGSAIIFVLESGRENVR